jgi:phage shock protein PspC (stress-responsive transcriptional regulator)
MRKHHFDRFDRFHKQPLMLDSANKKLGGVCAGVARYLDVPSLYVRLAAIGGLCFVPQAILIAYGLGYVILDDEEVDDEPYDNS